MLEILLKNHPYYPTGYKRNKNDCTSHFTKADIIEKAVLEAIQLQISFADVDEVMEEIAALDKAEYCSEKKNLQKVEKAEHFDQMETRCEEALAQIEAQQYARPLMDDGYRPVLKYGICFFKKGCIVRRA